MSPDLRETPRKEGGLRTSRAAGDHRLSMTIKSVKTLWASGIVLIDRAKRE